MKRPPERREQDVPSPAGEDPSNAAEEQDIDRILADSFPASDAPPWTLGVTTGRSGHGEIDRHGDDEPLGLTVQK